MGIPSLFLIYMHIFPGHLQVWPLRPCHLANRYGAIAFEPLEDPDTLGQSRLTEALTIKSAENPS
jgi:hypothetical protein